MAITRISEFTFGFAFLFEQTQRNWADLVAAPVLPSLKQEEEEGWDANLPVNGTEFYYQFKMTDYLRAAHAKYRRTGPEKRYDAPYFRFSLHRHNANQQHQRLRTLCGTKPNTYYVAPEMPDLEVFNTVFLARQIANSSRLIPLTACRDYFDRGQHFVTYQLGDTGFTEHSEPTRKEGSARGADIEGLYRRSSAAWKPLDEHFARTFFDETRSLIERDVRSQDKPRTRRDHVEEDAILRVMGEEPTQRSRQALIRRSAELASLYFGTTLTLVGSPADAG